MRRLLLIAPALLLVAGCANSRGQERYWRRIAAPTQQYLSGPQAQAMLDTAFVECQVGMERANDIQSPRLVKRFHYNDADVRDATQAQNEGGIAAMFPGSGKTEAEVEGAAVDACMRQRGWERVNWVE